MKLVSLCATAIAALFAGSPAFAQDYPEMTLRYSSNIPEVISTSKVDTYFSSEIERRSDGKIKIQHFWANTLGGEAEIVDLVGSGAVDLGLIVMGNQASRMPFAAVTNSLPLTYWDGPTINELTRDIMLNNPTAALELERENLHPVLFRYLPDYRVYCTSPIRTMEDFQNKKIRSYGSFVPTMFTALGAIPVNIQPVDMIQAMQTGALDCTYMYNSSVTAFKVDQAADYATDLSFGVISAHTLFIAKDKWESWPEDVRTLFEEVAADAEAYGNELIANDEAEAIKVITEAGLEIVPFEENDAFQAAVPDMLDIWVEAMGRNGLGTEAQDLAEFIRDYR